jgi:hypothetical protein
MRELEKFRSTQWRKLEYAFAVKKSKTGRMESVVPVVEIFGGESE